VLVLPSCVNKIGSSFGGIPWPRFFQLAVQLMMIMGDYFRVCFMMNAVDQHLPAGREALLFAALGSGPAGPGQCLLRLVSTSQVNHAEVQAERVLATFAVQ